MKDNKILKVTICTIVILGLMMAGGYSYMYNNGLSGRYANTDPKEGQIKVACIGDSITYGHGVTNWETENYRRIAVGVRHLCYRIGIIDISE